MESIKALFRMFTALFTKAERVIDKSGSVVVKTSDSLDNYASQIRYESIKSVVQAKQDLETHFGGRDQLRNELQDYKELERMLDE